MGINDLKRTPNKVNKRLGRKNKALYLAGVVGVALVTTGLLIIFNNSKATNPAVAPSSDTVVTSSVIEPSESKPTDDTFLGYKVGASDPRMLSIPDLGIKALVQKVGLTKEQAIAVPTNIYFTGWYVGSVSPGDIGLSIIDGHVAGSQAGGIFKNLVKAEIGQIITIEFGDTSVKRFSVVDVKIVPEEEAATALFNQDKGIERQLNLITCTGKYNNKIQSFDDRIIVVSKYIE